MVLHPALARAARVVPAEHDAAEAERLVVDGLPDAESGRRVLEAHGHQHRRREVTRVHVDKVLLDHLRLLEPARALGVLERGLEAAELVSGIELVAQLASLLKVLLCNRLVELGLQLVCRAAPPVALLRSLDALSERVEHAIRLCLPQLEEHRRGQLVLLRVHCSLELVVQVQNRIALEPFELSRLEGKLALHVAVHLFYIAFLLLRLKLVADLRSILEELVLKRVLELALKPSDRILHPLLLTRARLHDPRPDL
mmetsp:Transcript_94165/g.141092  ORF Transcript_94165/g.141092 Transcript_94165/m.141092 type:complete len:255 (-) Transcript_94165:900-1664(-)